RGSHHSRLANLCKPRGSLGKPAGEVNELVSQLTDVVTGQKAPAMGRCDENYPRHVWLRLKEHRAGGQIARLGIEVRLVKRYLGDVAPETIAAIDNHHFGQKTTLAMTDYYHLAKRRVLSLGIDVPSHRLERLAQPHRRQDDGIAAVVNEEPDLKARGYCGVAK